jgi:hypothetical protein
MAAEERRSEYVETATFGLGEGPTEFYDTGAVWALTEEAPVHVLPLSAFAGWYESTAHWDEGVAPGAVLARPALYPEHARRIEEADMAYPILVYVAFYPDRAGPVYLVADGNHRLARAFRDGLTHVRVKYVTKSMLQRAVFDEE